jgi:hypothetical protein
MAHFQEFSTRYRAKVSAESANPELATEIATVREAVNTPNSAALALLAAMVDSPDLMALPRESDLKNIAAIKAEAADPDLAMLRWAAARGLLLGALFGMSPIGKPERDRLFARLLDDGLWRALEKSAKPRVKAAAKAATARKRA